MNLPLILAALLLISLSAQLVLADVTSNNFTSSNNALALGGWLNPTNAYSNDAANAVASNQNQSRYGGFNFNIPAGSTISGITVRIEVSASTGTGTNTVKVRAWNGSTWSAENNSADIGTAVVNITMGGTAHLWGLTWTVDNANNISFNVTGGNSAANRNLQIDFIQANITYTPPDTTPPTCSYSNFSVTDTSFMVNHSCNEAANLTVRYGLTTNLGTVVSNATSAVTTYLNITSLSSGTTYFWNASSCDSSNNCQNTTTTYSLTTLGCDEETLLASLTKLYCLITGCVFEATECPYTQGRSMTALTCTSGGCV